MLVGAAVVAASCGQDRDVRSDPTTTTTPATAASDRIDTAPAEQPTTTAPRGPLGNGRTVTLAFAGDASFQGLTDAVRADPQGLLSEIAPTLGAADVTVVNLEAALGTSGAPEDKEFTFQAPPEALTALAAAGTDAVSMANNHGVDYGPEGLQDSLRIRAASGFPVLGIGNTADEAYAPFITEVKGQRVGVVAASDVINDNLRTAWIARPDHPGIASAEEAQQERLVQEVAATRERVDTLVVFLHWGVETQTCPNSRQQDLARVLTAAGADIVVGSHAHRLQGMGYLGDQFIAYGLSNFIFRAPSESGRRSGVLTVSATGRRIDGYRWDPASIRNSIPVPLTGAAAEVERAAMDQLQGCTGLTSTATGPGTRG